MYLSTSFISKSLAGKISREVLSRMHCGETRESVARLVAQEILEETRTEQEKWLLPVAIVVPLFFITVVIAVIGKAFENKQAMFCCFDHVTMTSAASVSRAILNCVFILCLRFQSCNKCESTRRYIARTT